MDALPSKSFKVVVIVRCKKAQLETVYYRDFACAWSWLPLQGRLRQHFEGRISDAVNTLRRNVRLLEVSFSLPREVWLRVGDEGRSADGRQQFRSNSREYRDRVVEIKQQVVAGCDMGCS
jgi:hypothetical protein